MAVMTERSAGDTTIRPFKVDIPEAELEDLRARVAGTRFHRDRRAGHSLHPRPLEARGRAPTGRLPRVAGIDRRAAEAHRPVTDPTAHGASASDAFDVVIPSMPGYGFSGKPTTTGLDPARSGSGGQPATGRHPVATMLVPENASPSGV
jgi:hypothetical protein